MKVLLTGATGFIGSHALNVLLEQGHEVHAVARRLAQSCSGVADLRPPVIWHEVDLLDADAAAQLIREMRPSHLLHLAWYAVPGKFWAAAENERWIDASLRLLRAFGEAGGRRAVMAGTCAEYAWGGDPLSERRTPLEPTTLYGACKHATHVAAGAVAAQLGVSLAWGRIFFLYGPGEHEGRLVPDVACALLAGEQVPTTEGSQRRDFLHVRDVAGAFAALLGSDVAGAVNVASGEAPPVREIVEAIAEQAGSVDRIRFGALPQRAGEPSIIRADVGRLTREVGFRPSMALTEGLAETLEWWRTQTVQRGKMCDRSE